MEPLHVAHLMVLAMWLGVVVTEVLFEFAGSDADSLHQDCDIVGRSGFQPDLHVVGVPAAANRRRERAAGIPAADLEPGGGRRGLRDPRSLSRSGLFPGLRDLPE